MREFIMRKFALAVMMSAPLLMSSPALAESPVGRYVAYIGQDDLYNSNGVRLTEPWQVLRQDRANYHRFGVSQPGDEWYGFFGSIDNRAIMERPQRSRRGAQFGKWWRDGCGSHLWHRINGQSRGG
jgi:hypothetical protein